MLTGTEATVCPADVHRQHPGVGEPVPDVWNLRAGAGAAVQWAGPGREPPVSVSRAGRRDSLGSPGALSELGVGAGGGGWPNSLSPSHRAAVILGGVVCNLTAGHIEGSIGGNIHTACVGGGVAGDFAALHIEHGLALQQHHTGITLVAGDRT